MQEIIESFQKSSNRWKLIFWFCLVFFLLYTFTLYLNNNYTLSINAKSKELRAYGFMIDFTLFAIVTFCFGIWKMQSAPTNNYNSSSKNKTLLDQLILSNKPFGLYLRDYFSDSIPIDTGIVFQMIPIRKDPIEHSLIKKCDRFIPFFAFLNVWDIDDHPIARRIYTDNNWFNTFKNYADKASFFVFNIDQISPAVKNEINYILTERKDAKVIITAPESILKSIIAMFPINSSNHWLIPRKNRRYAFGGLQKIKVPKNVIQFIKSLR